MYEQDLRTAKKKVFVSYLDEGDKQISGYFILKDISQGVITLETDQNILRIPLNRVIKIKEGL